jgi:hypothetical protein
MDAVGLRVRVTREGALTSSVLQKKVPQIVSLEPAILSEAKDPVPKKMLLPHCGISMTPVIQQECGYENPYGRPDAAH